MVAGNPVGNGGKHVAGCAADEGTKRCNGASATPSHAAVAGAGPVCGGGGCGAALSPSDRERLAAPGGAGARAAWAAAEEAIAARLEAG